MESANCDCKFDGFLTRFRLRKYDVQKFKNIAGNDTHMNQLDF